MIIHMSCDKLIAEPYCQDIELTAEDQYLILACDGLWDVMTDQDACDFLLAKVKATNDADGTHILYASHTYTTLAHHYRIIFPMK